MKDYTKAELESARPDLSPIDGINHALEALYRDESHELQEEIVSGLSFEELIGTLLVARDVCKRAEGEA